MNCSVLGLGAGGWQVWSLHNSLRSVSQEAYKWGRETRMGKKELLLWKWKARSRHPGTMHGCAVALDYLISTVWYNEITFIFLACRFWSLKPYPWQINPKILLTWSRACSSLDLEWDAGERQPSISAFETWCWWVARRSYYSHRN